MDYYSRITSENDLKRVNALLREGWEIIVTGRTGDEENQDSWYDLGLPWRVVAEDLKLVVEAMASSGMLKTYFTTHHADTLPAAKEVVDRRNKEYDETYGEIYRAQGEEASYVPSELTDSAVIEQAAAKINDPVILAFLRHFPVSALTAK